VEVKGIMLHRQDTFLKTPVSRMRKDIAVEIAREERE
jgi:hypothetical protein